MNTPAHLPALYRIRIRGHLDPVWSAWFDSLTVTQADDGTTELTGPLVERAAGPSGLRRSLGRPWSFSDHRGQTEMDQTVNAGFFTPRSENEQIS